MPMRPPLPGSRPRSRLRGFTLIELLVALSIMAVMAAMAWQGVDAVVRSREITQAHMERLLRLQSVMSQWEIDLREVHDSQVVPGLNFDGATLRLTRRRPEGLQVVAWTLRGGNVISIPKAADPEHVRQNAAARHIVLSPEDLATLDAGFAPPTRKRGLAML